MIQKIKIVDSKKNKLDELDFDTSIYKLMFGKSYPKRHKTKYVDDATINRFMIDNNIYMKWEIIGFCKTKRDGFEISIPSMIMLITDITDDRPTPGFAVSDHERAWQELTSIYNLFR